MRITCPNCGFSKDVPEHKIPKNAQIATCPKCSYKFKFRELDKVDKDFLLSEGIDESPKPNVNMEEESFEEFSEALKESEEDYVPWERIDKYGFFNALVLTIKKVMFHPYEFFKRLSFSKGLSSALVFYLIICEIQALTQVLWGFVGILKIEDPVKAILGFSISGISSVLFLVFYPLFLAVILFFGSAINHLCLKIVGSGKSGFRATFKVVSYSIAPMWLSIIPIVGAIVGSIWSFVLSIIGFASIHDSSINKVILAVLLPIILLLILIGIKGSI